MALSLTCEWPDRSVPLGKYWRRSPLYFHWIRAAGILGIAEMVFDVARKRKSCVISLLRTPIPSKRRVEFLRQFARMLDQCVDDVLAILARALTSIA